MMGGRYNCIFGTAEFFDFSFLNGKAITQCHCCISISSLTLIKLWVLPAAWGSYQIGGKGENRVKGDHIWHIRSAIFQR
jgi:hypothetical protein